MREEARTILGGAAPDVEVPPLEELRERARARPPETRPLSARLYRLGWAASVMLALGTGWLLRGGPEGNPARSSAEAPPSVNGTEATVRPPSFRDLPGAAVAREPETVPLSPIPSGASTDEPAGSGSAPVAAVGTRERAGDPSERGAPRAAEPPSVLLSGTVAAGLPAPALPTSAPLAPPSLPAALRETVAERRVVPEAGTSVRDAEPDRRSSQGRALTSAISADAALGRDTRARGDADVDSREDADSGSLVVPGLELIAVLPVGEGRTFAGMRALQRLANGDTLEVVHLAEGVPPSTLPPVGAGRRELVLERGAGWIVLRAPRTDAELRALLQRLEADN